MAAELHEALGVDSAFLPSHGGVFEVAVDGKRIFSKKDLGRFPNEGEILQLIRAKKKG